MKARLRHLITFVFIFILVVSIGNIVMAEQENEIITDEPTVIAAEDIGIKEIENEEFDEELEDNNTDNYGATVYDDVDNETATEDETLNDNVLVEEEIPEIDESETESPAPLEGKVEGYVSGVYFDPNTVDCEICGGECYTCHNDDHVYAHSVYVGDEGYIYEEWCTVCGHGTEKPISDEEFDALGVETDVEF